mmetsp:Transcript_27334/g.26377  ORF Transcript_27334/g.26377 Transcript_27334/m.26377 type:complete len:312 (+) Transcript_27334:1040-1975(+)
MMQPIIDNVTQVVESCKEPANILQIIKLNKSWASLLQNVDDIKNEDDKEKVRSQVLNYYPIINACVNRFNLLNEQIQKMQAQFKHSQMQKNAKQPLQKDMNWNDFSQQLNSMDFTMLKLLKSCCKNLQPKKDQKSFIDIEKKLTPLFRMMLEDNQRPYLVLILKVAEAMVQSKSQMTPTTSYALKNLETYFNHQQQLKAKLLQLQKQLKLQQQENYQQKTGNQPNLYQIQQQITLVQKQIEFQGKGMIIRAQTFQRFLAYGQEFFRVNSNYLLSISEIVIACLNDHDQRHKNNDLSTNQLFQIVQILFLNH